MNSRILITAALSLAALAPLAANAQDTFSFNNPALYTGTPLANGSTFAADAPSSRTLTITSPGTFQIDNANVFKTGATGYLLEDLTGVPGDTLTLTFAQPITTLSLDFGIVTVNAPTGTTDPDLLTITGGGATSSDGGVYDAGTTAFNGTGLSISSLTPFSTVLVSLTGNTSTGDFFGIDTITVGPSVTAVPEPGALAMLAAGVLPVAWGLRRRANRGK